MLTGNIATASHTRARDRNRIDRRTILTTESYPVGMRWSTQLPLRDRLHPVAKLLFPIVKLGVAQAESEHGVGQLAALPVARMDADQDRSIVALLNIPRVELRSMHGVVQRGGRTKRRYCAQNRYLILGQFPASIANRRRFVSAPPGDEYDPNRPSEHITRWHGTIKGMQLPAMQFPTARAARGEPAFAASSA